LPDELKDENPLGIRRLINGAFTRDPLWDEVQQLWFAAGRIVSHGLLPGLATRRQKVIPPARMSDMDMTRYAARALPVSA
jgi:hypothetical protein